MGASAKRGTRSSVVCNGSIFHDRGRLARHAAGLGYDPPV